MPREKRKLTPVQARARRIRHIGYVLYASAVLWLAVSLSAGVIKGLQDGTARDPFVDERVEVLHAACTEWADALLSAFEEGDGTAWRIHARGWRHQCGTAPGDAPEYLRALLDP